MHQHRERAREREEEKLQAADQNHTSCNNKHPRDHSDIWTHCESLGVAHKRWGGGRKHISASRSHFSFSGLKVEFWFQVEFGITTTAQKAIRAPQRRHWSWSWQQQKAQHKRTRSALNQTSWMKHKHPQKSVRTKQKVAHKLQPHRIKRRASGNKERKSPNVRLHDQHVHPCWI